MAFSLAATAAGAPAGALRGTRRAPLAQPRPAPCGGRRPALRVRASVHEEKAPDHVEGVGRYLARAAASLFLPADDHGAPFTLTPYSGTKLTAKDRAHLARYEQVLCKTRDTLEAMPSDAPHRGSTEHKDIGAPPLRPQHGRDALALTRVRAQAIGWPRRRPRCSRSQTSPTSSSSRRAFPGLTALRGA